MADAGKKWRAIDIPGWMVFVGWTDGLSTYIIGLSTHWMLKFRRAGEPYAFEDVKTKRPWKTRMSRMYLAVGPLRVMGPVVLADWATIQAGSEYKMAYEELRKNAEPGSEA